jgi:hypothetical protein
MSDDSWNIFADATAWLPVASGEVELLLAPTNCDLGAALKMEYNFKGGGGFAVARRVWRGVMPEAFVLRMHVSGRGAMNHLEVKLVDPSNQNVWRYQLKNFRASERGRWLSIPSQLVEFAWGPAGGGAITELGAVEIAIVAGEGGSGVWTISDFSVEDLSFTQQPKLTASSAKRGHTAAKAMDGEAITWWEPTSTDTAPWITLDAGTVRVLGGLVIDWQDKAPRLGFRVRTSNDGFRWRTRYAPSKADGTRSYVYLPKTQARIVRLEMKAAAGIRELKVASFEFSRSLEAFWHQVAQHAPRGHYPRWLLREQSLWTPIGRLHGLSCALMNEQGLVEMEEASFSLEPFLSLDGAFYTWADVAITQKLKQDWMPIPSVVWTGKDWSLTIEAFSVNQQLSVRYRLEAKRKAPQVKLYVLLRPFQVTPPWQHFRNVGGVSKINKLNWNGETVLVNGNCELRPTAGATFGALAFDEGDMVAHLSASDLPDRASMNDPFGFATGALCFEGLEAGIDFQDAGVSGAWQRCGLLTDAEAAWADKFSQAQITTADWGKEVLLSMRTAAAHVISTRAGAALQPGPRRYTRSWIRDGTIMCAALLRMGCAEEVRDFIAWYEPFLRADGFVPCCVDRDGPDWLVEHDSHGQWLALVAEYHAFSKDNRWLKARWPHVRKVVECIAGLLEPTGLMPISVSHEGYLAQPVHSYWDDFWTVRGLRDAALLASHLGKQRLAQQWQQLADRVETALYASIESTRASKNLDYIPASLEWADFDPTATANALSLLDVPGKLDVVALECTFNRYLSDWRKKRTGELPWSNYTPYEIRIIGAFVRIGNRAAALELLRFFLKDRRPLAWNQWPEIAWRDPSAPGHVGDIPHTWIGAEYVLAVQSLFAYEDIHAQTLVVAAGLAPEWLEGDGVQVRDLPTRYGLLNYSLRRVAGQTLEFSLQAGLTLPANGLVLKPPLPGGMINVEDKSRKKIAFSRDAITLSQSSIYLYITHE